MLSSRNTYSLLVAFAFWPACGHAGEIAGVPANAPPFVDGALQVSFSNDFLGRGGAVDDFRTQQLVVQGEFKDRWVWLVDHSILTLVETDEPGRTDQLSASLGFRFIDRTTSTAISKVMAGGGLRRYGDLAGERMQNGFHQLVGSSIEFAPYTDLERTDAVAWVDAQHSELLRGSRGSESWYWGYWLRASSLGSTHGQLDSALGAYLISGRRSIDLWVGLRQDWRSGYDEPVLRETAAAEQALAGVLGLRWGSLVLETVQQFDGDGSYGQLRLLGSTFGERRSRSAESRFALDTGITVPDVYWYATGRWRPTWLEQSGATWRTALFASVTSGKPQYDDDPEIYLDATQVALGLEWERQLAGASIYASLGAGWRDEKTFGEGGRDNESSASISSELLVGGLGVRVESAELINRFNLRLQLGLTAWAPFESRTVALGNDNFRVLRSGWTIGLGVSLGRFATD